MQLWLAHFDTLANNCHLLCHQQCNCIHYYLYCRLSTKNTHTIFYLTSNDTKTKFYDLHEHTLNSLFCFNLLFHYFQLIWTHQLSVCSTDCEEKRIKNVSGKRIQTLLLCVKLNIDWYPCHTHNTHSNITVFELKKKKLH